VQRGACQLKPDANGEEEPLRLPLGNPLLRLLGGGLPNLGVALAPFGL
jgi:hypothetical protein